MKLKLPKPASDGTLARIACFIGIILVLILPGSFSITAYWLYDYFKDPYSDFEGI